MAKVTSKTISQGKYQRATSIIAKTAEPRIKKIVDELNQFFANEGVRIGAEVQWFLDEIGAEKANALVEEDKDNG